MSYRQIWYMNCYADQQRNPLVQWSSMLVKQLWPCFSPHRNRLTFCGNCAPLTSASVWTRNFSSFEEFITEFCRECRLVCKGSAGDLKKAMKGGKPIIIEGIHLDPSIYLMEEDNKAPVTTTEKKNSVSVASDNNLVKQAENSSASVCGSSNSTLTDVSSGEKVATEQGNKIADSLKSVSLSGTASDPTKKAGSAGETLKDTKVDRKKSVKNEKSGADPIVVPIVLKMADFDHKALLEEWISSRTVYDKTLVQDKNGLIRNLETIQDYLCSFKSQGLTVVYVSATTFLQTLDWLHGYLLQCTEQGISSASNKNGRQPGEN